MSVSPSDSPAKRNGGFLPLWLLLAFIWIAANSSLAPENLVTGAVIAGALAYLFSRQNGVWQSLRVSPRRIWHFLLYTGVFVIEIVKANLNMLRFVWSPRIAIKPGVVAVKTRLKSPIGRLALANSIALTPGSLVLELEGDTLFIHWLDVSTDDPDERKRRIAGPFEDHLEKVFE
jgi:multicomponent Na+:H+ antiporter subunit E